VLERLGYLLPVLLLLLLLPPRKERRLSSAMTAFS